MLLEELVQVARGEVEVDLLLKNAQLVNVFSGQIHPADVAVHQDRVVGFGEYRARQVVDLNGQYLCPGFIDGHMHLESSMLRVAEFAMVNVLSIVLFAMLGQFLLGSPVLALVFGVVGFFLPRLYVNLRKRRRLNQFNDQLGDTITLLANSLRSGFSIVQSMETVAQQLPPPIATEFHRVVQEIGLGLHYEQALGNMLRRVPSDDLDLMITAINIQGKVGGNLAEILDTIGHTIRERVRIKGEVRVLTAQQMISGYVLTGLPIILGIVLYMINQDYIGQMFTDPCGWIMLGTAALMVALGFLIIRKIVNIEV